MAGMSWHHIPKDDAWKQAHPRGRQPLRKTAPAAVKLAKRLSGRGLSLRRISAKLAEAGQLNENGQPYNAQSIRAMLRGPQKRERRLKRLWAGTPQRSGFPKLRGFKHTLLFCAFPAALLVWPAGVFECPRLCRRRCRDIDIASPLRGLANL